MRVHILNYKMIYWLYACFRSHHRDIMTCLVLAEVSAIFVMVLLSFLVPAWFHPTVNNPYKIITAEMERPDIFSINSSTVIRWSFPPSNSLRRLWVEANHDKRQLRRHCKDCIVTRLSLWSASAESGILKWQPPSGLYIQFDSPTLNNVISFHKHSNRIYNNTIYQPSPIWVHHKHIQ